ncbi:hypothetical protein cyc_05300 [Cyclospora cayetanensis]|uniref:Coiled-coil domain-containing protein 153 n=1 Tax=Cyclospora cayetanensis TaxID=88456 RepID=A0A1D3CUB2_9EIME|nr:hypothetical protein cyc_05300 [Cyclospora cayetanensis]
MLPAALQEEQTQKSERSAESLREKIEALNAVFVEQDRQMFSDVSTLSFRNAEAKAHHRQLIQGLQSQLQAAEGDVAVAETDLATTRAAKEHELQQSKEALHHLQKDVEKMTFEFAEILTDTAEKVMERVSMSHGSWAAEQKRRSLDGRLQDESAAFFEAPPVDPPLDVVEP